jgi:hypothetical protein
MSVACVGESSRVKCSEGVLSGGSWLSLMCEQAVIGVSYSLIDPPIYSMWELYAHVWVSVFAVTEE